MKIGINARFLLHPFTGIGQYTRSLIPALAEVEPQNEYLLFTPELVDIALPENCRQIRVAEKPSRSASIQKAHWEHTLLPTEMERFGVDVAHFLYPSNPNRRLSMPTIVTVHDVIPWKLKEYRRRLRSKLYHFYARLALKKASHLLTVSEFSKNEIASHLNIKKEKITVAPLAPPSADEALACPRFALRRPYFLYVGGYDDRKNVPALIHAYQKHIAPYYAIDLILVGGKNRGLDELITDAYCERIDGKFPLKPKGQVIFTEPLDQAELVCLYRQAMAFAHPSQYEGFNLTLTEAMAAGIPIVASDIPAHREVTDGHAVFVDPNSVDSIGTGMHRLVNDPALQKELKEAGIRRAQDFSWRKTAEETLYAYHLFT